MNRATFAPLGLLTCAALASAAVGTSYVTEKCHELLAGVENEGHSHFEVAALCRARFPSNLCREGLNRLGRQPWSVATMRSACSSWDAEWKAHALDPAPARRTQDLVEGIEYTMDKKHELGICTALDFNECLQFKAKKYPEIVNNVTRIVGEIDAAVQGKDSQADAPTAPATVDDEVPGTTAEQVVADDEVPGTTAEPVVAEWADFHKTLNFSGRQSHLPWAAAGFAAGICAGALIVARATSGLRWKRDIVCVDGTQCMSME